MSSQPAPIDKDTVTMVVNTIESWKQQRQFHMQKLAELDELFRRIGLDAPGVSVSPRGGDAPAGTSKTGGSSAQIKVQPNAAENFQPRRAPAPNPDQPIMGRLADDDFEQYIAQTKAKLASGSSASGASSPEGSSRGSAS